MSGWRARALVATAWGLSVAFSIPIIFLYEEKLIQVKITYTTIFLKFNFLDD